jgi:hypothetical protein
MRQKRWNRAKVLNLRPVIRVILPLVACLVLVLPVFRQAQDVVLAQASANYDLSWHVIGSGGGQMGGSGHTIASTIGQPAVGTMGGSGHALCSGFWCFEAVEHRVYLPLVLRDAS